MCPTEEKVQLHSRNHITLRPISWSSSLLLLIDCRKRIYLFFGFIVFIPIFSHIWINIFIKYPYESFFRFILAKILIPVFFWQKLFWFNFYQLFSIRCYLWKIPSDFVVNTSEKFRTLSTSCRTICQIFLLLVDFLLIFLCLQTAFRTQNIEEN
jgi:hypothetical protein